MSAASLGSEGSLPAVPAEAVVAAERSATAAPRLSLVDQAIDATLRPRGKEESFVERFLRESSVVRALATWFHDAALPRDAAGLRGLVQLLQGDVARLDALLTEQINAILHHPALQALEASWRGLCYLVERAVDAENVKIRVLGISWKEIVKDVEQAIEFDQSQLFQKVYENEFGSPGGEPFSVLLGDFQIHPRPSREHPFDDVSALTKISQVAAAAFAPFICSVHPALFGVDEFAELEHPLNLSKAFQQLDYLKWRAFRETEDSRFVGLALPQILLRLPHEDNGRRIDGFCFQEQTSDPGQPEYLWGNAAYAFGGVLVRAFSRSGWLQNIHGVERDVVGGGVVEGLPVHCFSTDSRDVAPKCSTDVIVVDSLEQELSELGFLPLCHCKDSELSAFYTAQSAQSPKRYDDPVATMNARYSAMLQHIFCVSRFAHYIKVLARDKIGSFVEAEECEDQLQRWLARYVAADSEASRQVKAEYPLREAGIRVRPHPGKPGCYVCVIHLLPHSDPEGLSAAIRITTELTPAHPIS
jgi:type VI secretion system protein ImpD